MSLTAPRLTPSIEPPSISTSSKFAVPSINKSLNSFELVPRLISSSVSGSNVPLVKPIWAVPSTLIFRKPSSSLEILSLFPNVASFPVIVKSPLTVVVAAVIAMVPSVELDMITQH